MGIVKMEADSSAQLKGTERVVAGIGGSGAGIGIGIGSEMVGVGGSVCVDIDAVEDWGVEGEFAEMEIVAVVGLTWIPTSTWEARTESWYSRSSSRPSEKASMYCSSRHSC